MKIPVYRLTRLCMMCLLVAVFTVFLTSEMGYAELNVDPNPPRNQVTAAPGMTQDQNILGKIGSKYREKAEAWASGLTNFAERIFKAFLLIDIAMFAFSAGFGVANGGKTIGTVFAEFALCVLLPAGFMYSVLHYYQPWSNEIIEGLKYIAGSVEPKADIGEGTFFVAGTTLFDNIYTTIHWDEPSTWGLIIVGIILVICYALIAMRILMIKCESYIVLNAGIIILGLGAFNQTRSYAINFIQYVFAISIKLYVMQLMVGIMFSFVDDFMKTKVDLPNLTIVMGPASSCWD